jgi:two-component system, cell cycle sensor histidine kinase and response regulator CckA
MLLVADTGIGMNAETVDRLFEPFFTTKKLGKGTGLGLATVYGIVQQHDGFLKVHSEVGNGTTFRVYFPSSTGGACRPQQDIAAIAVTGSETILVAEDHEGVREVANTILRSYGYTIIPAADGEEALRFFRQDPTKFDLVILDVAMPGLSGTEAFAQMTAIKPNLPVIFTSGHTSESFSLNSAIADGAVFLRKPYTSRKLGQTVRSTLDRHRQSKLESSPHQLASHFRKIVREARSSERGQRCAWFKTIGRGCGWHFLILCTQRSKEWRDGFPTNDKKCSPHVIVAGIRSALSS